MSSERTGDVSRRTFLHTTGGALIGGAAAALAVGEATGVASAQLRVPPAPGPKLGFAVVGLGSLAINQILPAFAKCERAKPAALVSGSRQKAETLAVRYDVDTKHIYGYDNFDAIANDPAIDIVYIVLPNSMHHEYTIRALKAGKHVLCEKPMANTPKECEEMIAAAKAANRTLMIGYRLHYEPHTQAMIAIARAQEFGPARVIVCDAGFNIGDPAQWRLNKKLAGGGSLMDIGIYALQAARYLSGEEPTEISAMSYTTPNDPRFKEVEETITFQLKFPSGVLAHCTSSYGCGLNRFRVFAPKGSFELEPALSYNGIRMFVHRGGVMEERVIADRDQFALEMDHLAESVARNTEPLTPGEEGLRDLRIMTAIYEAARTGATVKL